MSTNETDIDLIRQVVMQLPDVEESTIHSAPSWKLKGKLLICPAIHKSAEPNSLLVKISPLERARLLAEEPETYYVTDHYRSNSVILVHLSQLNRKSLQTLIQQAWQFVHDSGSRPPRNK